MRWTLFLIPITIFLISISYLVFYYTDRSASRAEYTSYVKEMETLSTVSKVSGENSVHGMIATMKRGTDLLIQGTKPVSGVYESNMAELIEFPEIDEEMLAMINPDYRAWLYIPGTVINYPVVEPGDNSIYIRRSFSGAERSSGCLFFDESMPAFSAKNTIIHGHNMKNRSMFGSLKDYRNWDYAQKHKRLFILFKGVWTEYRFDEVFDDEITEPKADTHSLTLSTCDGRERRLKVRFIKQAVFEIGR